MMLPLILATALAVLSVAHALNQQSPITWYSTTLISEDFSSSRTIKYGNTAVTPVPTSTAPIFLSTSYLSEPTVSRDINRTTWTTVTDIEPSGTSIALVYTTPLAPPTVTQDVTTTDIWTSPVVATITLPAVTPNCNNAAVPSDVSTVTKYTGKYQLIPGQPTTDISAARILPSAISKLVSGPVLLLL
ncbi:hypothetical protein V8F33_011866 [Rhypophila sp. PSN 637]